MTKAWVVTTLSEMTDVEVVLYEKESDALYHAEEFIRERTGGPSAWRHDEWHEMRDAMVAHDVRKQIELFHASFSDWKDGFVKVEQQEVRTQV